MAPNAADYQPVLQNNSQQPSPQTHQLPGRVSGLACCPLPVLDGDAPVLRPDDGVARLDDRVWSLSQFEASGFGNCQDCVLFCHCQTSLIADFRIRYPEILEVEGNRALLLPVGRRLPEEALANFIALALTYHQRQAGNGPGSIHRRKRRGRRRMSAPA